MSVIVGFIGRDHQGTGINFLLETENLMEYFTSKYTRMILAQKLEALENLTWELASLEEYSKDTIKLPTTSRICTDTKKNSVRFFDYKEKKYLKKLSLLR